MVFVANPPDAASLMTSARSFGNYDVPGGLADLIHDSIRARAKRVNLPCLYEQGNPTIRVIKGGHGMSPGELRSAASTQVGCINKKRSGRKLCEVNELHCRPPMDQLYDSQFKKWQ